MRIPTGSSRLVAAIVFFMPWVGRAQPAVWADPVQFQATNAGHRWAITALIKGQVVSDGKTVDVFIESADLSRANTFDTPDQVVSIEPGIVRHNDKGEWQPVIKADRIPVDRVVIPSETVKLGSFRAHLDISDYPLATGDSLFFDLSLTGNRTVSVHGTILPVTQSLAWCATSWEQFKHNNFLQVRHFCQDTYGRTRTESWSYPSMDAPSSSAKLVSVHIADPVSNWLYDFNLREKKAFRRRGFSSQAGFGAAIGGVIGPPPGTSAKPVESDKWLGVKQVNGVPADGDLHTTVYPPGYQGPQEAKYTEETWYCWRISQTVRRVTSHSISGDYEMDLKEITLAEPDAALFRVPADYEVLDR